MDDEFNQSTQPGTGLYSEVPPPHAPHVINYLNYLGSILLSFRVSQPAGEMSSQRMAERVERYTGQPVSRQRITRAESGDRRVSMDIYAALLNEMGAWPDILWALEKGSGNGARFALLVERELSTSIKEAHKDGLKRLRQKQLQEGSK